MICWPVGRLRELLPQLGSVEGLIDSTGSGLYLGMADSYWAPALRRDWKKVLRTSGTRWRTVTSFRKLSRHFPFPIGPAARDSWLRHMNEAIDASDAAPDVRDELRAYMALAADALLNVDETAEGSGAR